MANSPSEFLPATLSMIMALSRKIGSVHPETAPCTRFQRWTADSNPRNIPYIHRGKKMPVIVLTNSRYENAVAYWKHNSFPVPDKWISIHRFITAANMMQYEARVKSGSNLNFAFDVLTAVTGMPRRWSIVYDNHRLSAAGRASARQ
jgi:hypothetical protein